MKSMDGKEYTISIAGVQKDSIQKFFYVLECLYEGYADNGDDLYYFMDWEDADFIDADKLKSSISEDAPESSGLDYNMCWAATCSNALWQSGWGAKAINPMTNDYFHSEDEIMTYITSRFVNEGYDPQEAIKWFMDGYAAHIGSGDNALLKEADNPTIFEYVDTTDGLLKDYYAANLLNTVTASKASYEILDFLSDLQNGKNTKSYGMTIWFWNEKNNSFDKEAHALNLVGVMTDSTATDALHSFRYV